MKAFTWVTSKTKLKTMSNERKSLSEYFARCFGGACAVADQCERYLHRHDDSPNLSYIQTGAFVDGACIYQIEPSETNENFPRK